MRITSGHDDVGFSLKSVGELVKENVPAFIEEVVKVPRGTRGRFDSTWLRCPPSIVRDSAR